MPRNSKYAFGTEISDFEGRAICPDGKVRKVNLTNKGQADTFFSIPASVRAYNKTVSGYVTVETVNGWSNETYDDPFVLKFVPYTYGINHKVFE